MNRVSGGEPSPPERRRLLSGAAIYEHLHHVRALEPAGSLEWREALELRPQIRIGAVLEQVAGYLVVPVTSEATSGVDMISGC